MRFNLLRLWNITSFTRRFLERRNSVFMDILFVPDSAGCLSRCFACFCRFFQHLTGIWVPSFMIDFVFKRGQALLLDDCPRLGASSVVHVKHIESVGVDIYFFLYSFDWHLQDCMFLHPSLLHQRIGDSRDIIKIFAINIFSFNQIRLSIYSPLTLMT